MNPNLQTVYKAATKKGRTCDRAAQGRVKGPSFSGKCTPGKAWPQADGKPPVKVVEVILPEYDISRWGAFGRRNGGTSYDWVEEQLLRYKPPVGREICSVEWPLPPVR